MSKVMFEDNWLDLSSDQSVLEGLLAHGYKIPNSCRAGICQACKMQLTSGAVNPQAQQGLPDRQVEQGIFLACCSFPKEDISVELIDSSKISHQAKVLDHFMLSHDVLCLRLASDVKWRAGQVINCIKDDTLIRSYSIASRPEEGFIELHIRIYPDGRFGQWAKNQLIPGDTLAIEAPFGDCVYDPSCYDMPLIMVATGTGLAPIYGVLKEALANHHKGEINIYLAAGEASSFYYEDKLIEWAESYDQFVLHRIVRRGGEEPSQYLQGEVEDLVLAGHKSFKNSQVFLCGSPSMVNSLKKSCFMRGASLQHILTDSFEMAQS